MKQAFYITQMSLCAIVMIIGAAACIFGVPLAGLVMFLMGSAGLAGGKMDYEIWKERQGRNGGL